MRIQTVLILFAAIFLACAAPGLTIRAMDCAIQPSFGGGNLTAEGQVGAFIEVPQAGVYTVEIKAYGNQVDNEWPKMALCVDGLPTERVEVEAKVFKAFTFKLQLSAHVHAVGAYFLNAIKTGAKSRNLYLDTITITPPDGAPEPGLSSDRAWVNDGAAREQEILDQTNDLIEKNRKGDATLALTGADGKPLANAEVTVELARHEFLFGCNFMGFQGQPSESLNKAYEERFAEVFNYATLPFYWKLYETEKGKPNYAQTDAMLAWCAAHGIETKAHPLLWANKFGRPEWANGKDPAPEVQKARVDDLMGRYKDKIKYWEVVNEPANQPGIALNDPYAWARAADPAAKLVVNEYGILYIGHWIFNTMLQKAVQENVPIDVIGIQGHAPVTEAFPLDRVWAVLDMYAPLKKDIHITEFSPGSNGKKISGAVWRKIWTEETQADYAEKFYRTCFAHPSMKAISWWDLYDAPGMFVENGGLLHLDMTPKPAYLAIKKLIKDEWHTKVTAKTDADGKLTLRGFYGAYNLTAPGKKSATATFNLTHDTTAPIAVILNGK